MTINNRPSIKDWTKNEFMEEMNQHLFDYEEASEGIWNALNNRKNILLYGKGGYAKSLGAEVGIQMITTNFYGETFLTSAGPGMDMTQFTGYTNVKILREEGKIFMEMEDTLYVQKRFAIIEEVLSAPPKVLMAMRDPLQRGFICVAGKCIPNTLESLFGCTNVDPVEWVKDMDEKEKESAKATLKRFHYRVKVAWKTVDSAQFAKYFVHQRGADLPLLSEMIGWANTVGKYEIDPRTAIGMYDIYSTDGLPGIRNYEGLPEGIFSEFQKIEARKPYISKVIGYETLVTNLSAELSSPVTEGRLNSIQRTLAMAGHEIKALKIPDDAAYTQRLSNAYQGLAKLNQTVMNKISARDFISRSL